MFKFDLTLKADNREELLKLIETTNFDDHITEYTSVIHVEVWDDDDVEPPTACGAYEIHSFSTRHTNYKNPDDLPGVNDMIETGQAQLLSYYEHGLCHWSLQGTGPQCQFDSVHTAGVLILSDDYFNSIKNDEDADLTKVCASIMETYTAWCNGSGYGYTLTSDDIELSDHDSCGGYLVYDDETERDFAREIAGCMPNGKNFIVTIEDPESGNCPIDLADIDKALDHWEEIAANV